MAEILATRNKEEILRIKMEYEHLYDKNLEEDIDNKTSGHLKRIFRSLLSVRFCPKTVICAMICANCCSGSLTSYQIALQSRYQNF